MTAHKRSRIAGTALAATAALLLAACSSSGSGSGSGNASGSAPAASSSSAAAALPSLKGQHLTVLAEWTGAEQADFQAVLNSFDSLTGASVAYQSGGSNTGTVLQTKIAGGSPPDVALLPEPGLINTLAQQGAIKPLTPAIQQEVAADYGPGWESMGTVDGKLYSVVYKASNKTTFWYNTAQFSQAGSPRRPTGPSSWPTARPCPTPGSPRSPSAARTAGPWPTGSRTSTSAKPVRRCTTSWRTTRSTGPTRP